jgi:hypothetical protein
MKALANNTLVWKTPRNSLVVNYFQYEKYINMTTLLVSFFTSLGVQYYFPMRGLLFKTKKIEMPKGDILYLGVYMGVISSFSKITSMTVETELFEQKLPQNCWYETGENIHKLKLC